MKCCANDKCKVEKPSFDSYSHICRECAKELRFYPRNSFSLLAACEALMMHHRGSSDMGEKEFFKLKNSIVRILGNWKATSSSRMDEIIYDKAIRILCEFVVNHIRWSL